MNDEQKRALVDAVTAELTDKGRLIMAGWRSFQIYCVPDDAPRHQIEETRIAFFAGAQHLFGSIMSILDPGEEPTDKDLDRMSLIADELKRFEKELTQRVGVRT